MENLIKFDRLRTGQCNDNTICGLATADYSVAYSYVCIITARNAAMGLFKTICCLPQRQTPEIVTIVEHPLEHYSRLGGRI